MYIEYVRNRKSPGCWLLRESYRSNGKVRKRTLANITPWPEHLRLGLEALLKGGRVTTEADDFEVVRSLPHGHVAAVLGTAKKLGLPKLLSSQAGPHRDRVLAMTVARILDPASKLATARGFAEETAFHSLGLELSLESCAEDDLYAAMDWLQQRQPRIESKLAKRHLANGGIALYDLTSTWYEGEHCPLAAFGHPRGGPKGKKQINFGLLCDSQGRPISVEVYKGNVADPKTIGDQVRKLRDRFHLDRVVLVGDRGMITEARIREELSTQEDWLDWISALRAPAIQKLAREEIIQPELFDQRDLAEVSSPDYPGERLVVCRNPLLATERARKREQLLEATERELNLIVEATRREKRPLKGKDQIGLRVGKKINRYKMGKHFQVDITETRFRYQRNEQKIAEESALDGIYVLRTSVDTADMDSEQIVKNYKSLSQAERAFRTMKTIDLEVHPIRHRLEGRVRAHVFLCMLAYYVEWHMRQALTPLLFDDGDKELAQKSRLSPVAPAQKSPSAKKKASTKRTPDGWPVHSFRTLLQDLATITRNKIRPAIKKAPSLIRITRPTDLQQKALDLLGLQI